MKWKITCLQTASRANDVRLAGLEVLHVDLHREVPEEEVSQCHSADHGHEQISVVDHHREHQGVSEHVVHEEDGGLGEEGTETARHRAYYAGGGFQREEGGAFARRTGWRLLAFPSGPSTYLCTVHLVD